MRHIVKNPKIVCLNGDYKSSLMMTIYNILVFKYHSKILVKIPEYGIFERFLKNNLRNYNTKIIHYWPKYSMNAVRAYKNIHKNVTTIADIYMPNEQFVIDYAGPILKPLGLDSNLDYIRKQKKDIEEAMSFETNFLVPSKFVADSYMKYYPDKNFYVIPYGITIWEHYHKKQIGTKAIRTFVYAGTVSVEKGCNMICEFFSSRPEMELHLYGRIKSNEDFVFVKYRNYKNIYFHGPVAKSILQKEMSQYDVGIHMSLFDAYSLSVGEMIGAGLPVIVSTHTGIKDDVEDYGLGLVCDLNYESIDACVKQITKTECYQNYVDSIDIYIKENHSSYGQKIVELYETLSSKKE